MQQSASAEWNGVFGEALSSPGSRRRNKKLTSRTPTGTHMSNEAAAWLTRHQNKAQGRLERKVASRLANLRRQPKAGDAGASPSSIVPLALRGWPGRMPPLATRGREPQVVVFDMDVLAERYRESLWSRQLTTSARPGLLAAGARLRERFLLCVLCRSPLTEATELVRALYDKGLSFDYAYALPPSGGRANGTPVLDDEAMRLLREEMGMTVASMGRRMLAVASLELEDAEIETRLPRPPYGPATAGGTTGGDGSTMPEQMPAWLGGCTPTTPRTYEVSTSDGGAGFGRGTPRRGSSRSGLELLGSEASPRPLVRLLLPGVTTLLVPHSRLQPENATIGMALVAELLFHVHRVAPHDWIAAHATRDPAGVTGNGAAGVFSTGSAGAGASWGSGGMSAASLADADGPPLADLAGLARLVVPAAELARAGLGPMPLALAGLRPLGRLSFGLANSGGGAADGGAKGDAEVLEGGAAEGVATGGGSGGKPSTGSSTTVSESDEDEGEEAEDDEEDDAIVEEADEDDDGADVTRSTAATLACKGSSALGARSTAPDARLLVLCIARLRAAGMGVPPVRPLASSRGGSVAPSTQPSPRPGLHAPELFGTAPAEASGLAPPTAHAASPARPSPLCRPQSRGGAGGGAAAAATAAIEIARPPSPSDCCDLSVAPFERWATEDAPTPPGAPPAPKIQWVDSSRDKRGRKRNKEKRGA